jgi:hypothetical protein
MAAFMIKLRSRIRLRSWNMGWQTWNRKPTPARVQGVRDHRKEKARRAELAAEETEEAEKARLAEMAEKEAEEAEKRGGGSNQVSGMDAWVGPGNSNSCIHLMW